VFLGLQGVPLKSHEPSPGNRYDSDGVLAMAPEVAAWAAKDAALHRAVDWRKAIEDARSDDAKAKKAAKEGDKEAKPTKAVPPPEPTKVVPEPPKAVPVAAAVAVAALGEVAVSAGGVLSDAAKGAAWRATLGRQTWFFLHTLAAKYPDFPSDVDQVTGRC
jgi:hypothetical protein